jgi:hypothetical protein
VVDLPPEPWTCCGHRCIPFSMVLSRALPVNDQLDLQLQVSLSQSSTPNVCGPTKDPAVVLTDRLVRRVGLFLAVALEGASSSQAGLSAPLKPRPSNLHASPTRMRPILRQGGSWRPRNAACALNSAREASPRPDSHERPSSNRALAPFGLRGADRMAPE